MFPLDSIPRTKRSSRVFRLVPSCSSPNTRARSRVQARVRSGTGRAAPSRESVDRPSRWYRQGQAEARAGQRSDGSLHPQAGRAYPAMLCHGSYRLALPWLGLPFALSCRARACQPAALGLCCFLARRTTATVMLTAKLFRRYKLTIALTSKGTLPRCRSLEMRKTNFDFQSSLSIIKGN